MSKKPTQTEKAPGMKRMQLMIEPELLDLIDLWRGQQPRPPNRSEAIREAVKRMTAGLEKKRK